jgi:hypothetical protein
MHHLPGFPFFRVTHAIQITFLSKKRKRLKMFSRPYASRPMPRDMGYLQALFVVVGFSWPIVWRISLTALLQAITIYYHTCQVNLFSFTFPLNSYSRRYVQDGDFIQSRQNGKNRSSEISRGRKPFSEQLY